MNSLISIIIPTFNRAKIIHRCLDSVKKQNYSNWECLVVDDYSEDNTKEVIGNYSDSDTRFRYLLNEREKGAPGARNTGLYAAKGEYIIFLDSDDLILSHCIESRLSYFMNDPELDLVIGLQKILDNGKETFYVNVPSTVHPLIRFYSLAPSVDIPWINNSCLIKKSFIVNNQIEWDETVRLYQDIQFNLNILIKNPIIQWSDHPFDSYWIHDKDNPSIGKQSIDLINKKKKIVEAYHEIKDLIYLNDKKIYYLINKQYHSCLLSFTFSYSVSKSEDFWIFIEFLRKKSQFSEFHIHLIKIRNTLDKVAIKKWHQKTLSKAITFYLLNRYSPVVKKGTFCKIL